MPGAGHSCKKLPVYSWMPGWVVYSFMLMPVLSLVAHEMCIRDSHNAGQGIDAHFHEVLEEQADDIEGCLLYTSRCV